MSSNKTIIPGMEMANTEPSSFEVQSAHVNNGTVVPAPFGTTPNAPAATDVANQMNRKPIVGFLYSISKSSSAEFWPVRIGSNSIGRSGDCDICLGEATVSEQHAILVVRQMKNPEKIIASVCDARSTCGTMINGESLGFDPRECFNGDIITIGEHYDLYFIMIDAKQIGLNVCHDFMPTHSFGNDSQISSASPYTAPVQNEKFTQGFDQTNTSSNTIGINGPLENKPGKKQGGTIFM